MKQCITFCSFFFLSLFSFAQIGLPVQLSFLPKNNLVVNYDFSKSSSFTRGATNLTNIAGTASGNATIVNSPIFFNSLGFISLNGTNQYVVTPNLKTYFKPINTSVQNSFTVSFWIYPTNLNGVVLSELDSQTPSSGWHASNIEIVNGFVKYRVWPGSTYVTSSLLTLNQWYHVAMVYDGSSVKGYLNGVLQGTQTYAREAPSASQNYAIGATEATNMGTTAYGNFHLAQFKLHQLPLTDNDILQEYITRKSEFDYTIHSPSTNTNPAYWSISSAWNNSTGSTGASDAFSAPHYTPWLNSTLGWAAQKLDANQFITLNYDEPASINGAVIQPRASSGGQFVTKVHVETSLTGTAPWTRVLSDQPLSTTITDDARVLFPTSVFAKAVKVIPVTWTNHITMRLGALVKPNNLVSDGLVLRLDPANINSYEGSGTTFKDMTTNAMNFNLVGTPTYDPSGFFTFNGTSQYASRAHTSIIKPTTAISIEQWLNADDWNAGTSTSYKTSISCTSTGGYGSYIWNGSFRSYIYAGGKYLITSASVSNFSGWHHFVTTFDGRYARLYIDGLLVSTDDYGSANKTISYASNSIFLGVEAGSSTSHDGKYWQGKIATTSIYNKALTDAEILQNYNNTIRRYSLQDNLVLHYDPSMTKSYPGSGISLFDLTDNGLTGTMSNITFSNPAFTYNGSSSQVSIPDNALLEPGTGNWTMEAWFKPTQFTSSTQTVLGKFGNGGTSSIISYAMRQLNGNIRADFSNGTTAFTSDNYAISLNTWVHMVYVWDRTNSMLHTYSNGVLKQSKAISISGGIRNNTTNLFIGSYNGGEYSQYYKGQIGKVRLYNKGLTASEVLNNFNLSKDLYGL